MTGEVLRARLGPGVPVILTWIKGLAGPVRVVYEAGPTGFGLARRQLGTWSGPGRTCAVT